MGLSEGARMKILVHKLLIFVSQRVWDWDQVWPELSRYYKKFGQLRDSGSEYLPLEYGTS